VKLCDSLCCGLQLTGSLKYSIRSGRPNVPKGMFDRLGAVHVLPLEGLTVTPGIPTEVALPLGPAAGDGEPALLATFKWVPASSLRKEDLQDHLATVQQRRTNVSPLLSLRSFT
jgi:hypothetical protein